MSRPSAPRALLQLPAVAARRCRMIARPGFIFLLLTFGVQSAHAQFDLTHARWDDLLKNYVVLLPNGHASQVDYAALTQQRTRLKGYLEASASVDRATFDAWSKSDQLAFLINAYNAWTVELILTAYPKLESIKDLGSFVQSPWKKRFIPLLGESRSLDDIEHSLIRGSGRYNDPRIHFAVNCASVGCSALKAEAFVGKRLDSQMEDATRAFLSDRSRNRLESNALKVSSIFKWYREDFEKGWRGAETLGQFFALYRQPLGLTVETASGLAAGKVGIAFLDYDWRLNATVGSASSGRP